ncbi:esterase [Terriglobus aquaticus]|uniref:Esterase n=2 Tax=Terriglobus aquaticus TaxID=940139 RepID=A0ABW9KP62_9BACT|nr:esterase [Terriglobus aquaticus]
MHRLTALSVVLAAGSFSASALSQAAAPPIQVRPANPKRVVSIDPAARAAQQQIKSAIANPDGSATFNVIAPNAKSVAVTLEGEAEPRPLQQDANGTWTLTTEPLKPEYYGYRVIVDDEREMDPRDPMVRLNLQNPSSIVHIPGRPSPAPWDLQDIPHGTVEHVMYTSKLATDEAGLHDRDLYVYLPPNYDAKRKQKFPVLYLLHGYSDSAIGWTDAGQANWIMDSLIQQGKIQPMVVVMPRAYGTMRMITEGWGVWTAPYKLPIENQDIFEQMMLKEIIPMSEARYNIATDSAHRALAGLSMGGGHSIHTGLSHPEVFGYVGAFSSAIVSPLAPGSTNAQNASSISDETYQAAFQGIVPNAKTQAPFKLFWLSCGTEDGLNTVNQKFGTWAKQNVKGNVSINQTPGMHTWLVWRDNLITFSQLLWK